jgi:hypothetical protein
MTQYVKSTSFASKDALPQGNPLKIVKGTEIDTEFNNIAVAVATKADLLNPVFAGTPTAATAALGTSTTQIATTAFVAAAVNKVAALSNFSLVESGTDLLIKHSGVTVAKITSAGALIVKADVTAFGSL